MVYKIIRNGLNLEVHEHQDGDCATLDDVEKLIHKQAELFDIDEVYMVSDDGTRTIVDWREGTIKEDYEPIPLPIPIPLPEPRTKEHPPKEQRLTICRDCGKTISKRAQSCPSCGAMDSAKKVVDPTPLSIIGIALLSAGVFAPLVSVPIIGTINYIANGKGDGLVILGFAFLAVVGVLSSKFKLVMAMGICSLIVMLITFVNFSSAIGDLRTSNSSKVVTVFESLAKASIKFEWGWAVLIIGAVLMVSAGIVRKGN